LKIRLSVDGTAIQASGAMSAKPSLKARWHPGTADVQATEPCTSSIILSSSFSYQNMRCKLFTQCACFLGASATAQCCGTSSTMLWHSSNTNRLQPSHSFVGPSGPRAAVSPGTVWPSVTRLKLTTRTFWA
jgi:hypothetical protein